jgi:hypothetical protein
MKPRETRETGPSGHTRERMQELCQRVTKRRIALIQLWRSIDLLENHGDPVCALTLAGSAEEILGKMAAKKGHSTALEDDTIWWGQMADFLKRPRPSQEKVRKALNRIRSELKHNESGRNVQIQAKFVFEAEEMILRALRNYEQAFRGRRLARDEPGKHPAKTAFRIGAPFGTLCLFPGTAAGNESDRSHHLG